MKNPGILVRKAWSSRSLGLISGNILLAAGLWGVLSLAFPDRSFLIPVSFCNLNAGPCNTYIPSRMSIEILPRPIVAGRQYAVSLATKDSSIDRVELELSAVELDMGTSLSALQKTDFGYAGPARVPACVHGNLTWRARVILYRGESVQRVSFFWKKSHRRFLSFLESSW